jgi:hypothetical protein
MIIIILVIVIRKEHAFVHTTYLYIFLEFKFMGCIPFHKLFQLFKISDLHN